MSLVPPTISPNLATSYVMPGKITYFPDGSYSMEKASYYSQQQALPSLTPNDNFAFSPAVSAPAQLISAPSAPVAQPSRVKRGLENAFNPQDLGRDLSMGGIAAVVWTGLDKLLFKTPKVLATSTPRLFLGNLILGASLFLGFGILARGFVGDKRHS